MKNYKITPAVYKIAIRAITWNHAIWNRNGYDLEPDAIAKAIMSDAETAGMPMTYSTLHGLQASLSAPGKAPIELWDAMDAIRQNKGKHATPKADRERHKEWLSHMNWYNVHRYDNSFINTTKAQDCAFYVSCLKDTEYATSSAKKLIQLSGSLTQAAEERKHELAARMNSPETVTQSLIYSATKILPF